MDLLLHPKTKQAISNFVSNPSHALLIRGQLGAGKTTIAKRIITQVLQIESIEKHPYFIHLSPEGTSISIEAVRTLRGFLSLKTTGSAVMRRAILVEDADAMTAEAQNALLKILEEPPADTLIIVTASKPSGLLPTVISRCQVLIVQSIGQEEAEDYFANQNNKIADIARAYYVSNGQAGLMSALLNNDNEHPLKAQVDMAKQLLALPLFERLTEIDKIVRAKSDINGLLFALKRIYHALLKQAATKHKSLEVKTAYQALHAITAAEEQTTTNVSTKLLLCNLFLHL